MTILYFFLCLAAMGLVFLFWLKRRNARIDREYRQLLKPEVDIEKLNKLVGEQGVCRSDCRPQGTIEVDGKIFAARAEGLIANGTRIEVVGFTVRTASTCLAGPMLDVRPC